MSVLVWDGKSLAADSSANNGDTAFPFPKVWEIPATAEQPRMLAGAIGPLPQVAQLRTWSEQGTLADHFPLIAPTTQLVTITKEKGLVRYNGNTIPLLHGNNKIAIGEGAPFAYGALYMGANAEQAVAAAIHYSVHCNGVPEVLSLW